SGPVLPVKLHKLGRDPDRFCSRARLQNGPAADDFLALGERTVLHRDLAVGEADPGAVLARQQPARVDERAVFERLLDELAHRLHAGGGGGGLAFFLEWGKERQIFNRFPFFRVEQWPAGATPRARPCQKDPRHINREEGMGEEWAADAHVCRYRTAE